MTPVDGGPLRNDYEVKPEMCNQNLLGYDRENYAWRKRAQREKHVESKKNEEWKKQESRRERVPYDQAVVVSAPAAYALEWHHGNHELFWRAGFKKWHEAVDEPTN